MLHLSRYIVFLFACTMVIREWLDVFSMNTLNENGDVTYVIPNSVLFSTIALGTVALSIFLKRNIWAYLFLFVLIASFFPDLSFTNINVLLFVGPIKLDMIAIPLLTAHILLNPYIIRKPELSKTEEEESTNEKIHFFMKQFEKKSHEELQRMEDGDLLPEAIEAKKKILAERGL